MFGDELILGKGTVKIDNKGRMFIPAHTKVEENDKIILEKSSKDNDVALKLHVYQKYFDILERFKQLRDNATSIEEFNRYEKEIEEISVKLHAIVTVDKQHRIIVPKPLVTALDFNANQELQYEGLGTSLLVSQKK